MTSANKGYVKVLWLIAGIAVRTSLLNESGLTARLHGGNDRCHSKDVIAKMEEPQTAVLPVFNTINDTNYAVIVCGTLVYPCKAVLLNPFLSGHISHLLAFLLYSAGEEAISIIHKLQRDPCQEEDNR